MTSFTLCQKAVVLLQIQCFVQISDSCDLGVSLVKSLEMIRKPVQTWAISLNQDEGEVIRLTEKKALLGILET